MLNFADRVWKNIVSRLYLLMTQRLHLQTTPQPVSDGQGRHKPGHSDGQGAGEAPHPARHSGTDVDCDGTETHPEERLAA